MSTIKVTNIQDTSGNNQSTSEQIAQGRAKAWADFDGSVSDPNSTMNGYNVNSITDNGAGDYTLNFTSNLANANYVVVASAHDDSSGNNNYLYGLYSQNNAWKGGTYYTTSSARVTFGYATNGSTTDCKRVQIVIFGD